MWSSRRSAPTLGRRGCLALGAAPLTFLAVMIVIFSFGNERFLTPFNASLIVQQVMFVGTLAIGQTIIILTAAPAASQYLN